MKHLMILFCALMVATPGLFSQNSADVDPDAPVVEFEFTTHDFGEIVEGDDATVDFYFTNTGKTDLIITNVKASCGCTTPYWNKEPVKPGEKGKITAKYNTKNRPGNFNKPITITSNASEPTIRIFIKGKVSPENSGIPERKPSIVNQ